MTLSEILPSFLHGKPIQREGMWGDDVYIETDGNRIRLYRNKKDKRECLMTFENLDRYFTLDDITADDWRIAKK